VRPNREKGSSNWGSILLGLAIAVVALLAAPAAFASVGKQAYEGPAATDGVDGRSPTVRVKIEFTKVNHRRGAPLSLTDFESRAIALRCPDGTKIYGGPGTELDGGPGGFDQLGFIPSKKMKKGNFALSEEDAAGLDTQTITGHVARKGNATGTIRVTEPEVIGVDGNGNAILGGTCDSGVVKWTASPVNAFSPVVQPPCAFQGTCPAAAERTSG
jgi:hypothetical protein